MNEQEELFNRWKSLGARVSQLGNIIQNSPEHIEYENYREFLKLSLRVLHEFNLFRMQTSNFILENCMEQWENEK